MTPPRPLRRSRTRWLRRAAEAKAASGGRGWLRGGRDWITFWPFIGSTRLWLLAIPTLMSLALLVALLPLQPPQHVREAVSIGWQVQAGILGLAVAVAIFAYQSMHAATGSRRRLILLTGFPTAMVSGIALIIVTGAAFVVGESRWSAWLGVFAMGLTAPWLVLLMHTVAQAPHLQDQRFALGMRLRVLREMTRRAVTEHVISRVGLRELETTLAAEGAAVRIWIGSEDHANRVTAERSGTLVDVSLQSLRWASRRVKASGGRLEVEALQLGTYVRPLSTIAAATVPIPEDVRRRLRDALVFGSSDTVSLADDLADLHEDALKAIENSPDLVDEVLTAYIQVLEDYAMGWKAFSVDLDDAHIPQWPEAIQAPVGDIRDSVLRLFDKSLERRARESASRLVYFPIDVMQRAVMWRAPAYFSLLQLAPSFYWMASRTSVPDDMRELFRDRSWLHLVEAMELMLPGLRKSLGDEYAELLDQAETTVTTTIFMVMRAAVRNGDWANFSEGLRRWRAANR